MLPLTGLGQKSKLLPPEPRATAQSSKFGIDP